MIIKQSRKLVQLNYTIDYLTKRQRMEQGTSIYRLMVPQQIAMCKVGITLKMAFTTKGFLLKKMNPFFGNGAVQKMR